MEFPEDFRCPISLEIMTDPVTLTSGHTFDRASIQLWLDYGNLTCPVTNLPLPTPHPPPLIPNHALRRLIHSSPFAPQQFPQSPPCPLKIPDISFPSDSQSLSSLLLAIQNSQPQFRLKLAESSVPRILLRHVAAPHHPDLQKLAICSLLYLSLESDDIKVGLVAEGAVDYLVTAVKSNAASAATVITSLATVDVNKVTIGAHPTAIPALTSMLLEGSSKREKKEAATAIYELCKFPENRRRVVRVSGSVRSLITLAGSGLDRAMEVLALLAKVKEGREEMGRIEGFARVLSRALESGTHRGRESAISVMSWVVMEEEGMGEEVVKEGVLGVLERLGMQEDGKVRKNVAVLLSVLLRRK